MHAARDLPKRFVRGSEADYRYMEAETKQAENQTVNMQPPVPDDEPDGGGGDFKDCGTPSF
jgi:hypothetical protein